MSFLSFEGSIETVLWPVSTLVCDMLTKQTSIDEFKDVLDDALESVTIPVLGRVEVSELELDGVFRCLEDAELEDILRGFEQSKMREALGCGDKLVLLFSGSVWLDLRNAARPCWPTETSYGSRDDNFRLIWLWKFLSITRSPCLSDSPCHLQHIIDRMVWVALTSSCYFLHEPLTPGNKSHCEEISVGIYSY